MLHLGVRSSGELWEPPKVVEKPQAWCKVWSTPSSRPYSGIEVFPCVGEAQGEYGEHNRALECLVAPHRSNEDVLPLKRKELRELHPRLHCGYLVPLPLPYMLFIAHLGCSLSC